MPSKKGFTLIELLVVVLIISILAAIALPMYRKAVNKTRHTLDLEIANTIRKEMNIEGVAGNLIWNRSCANSASMLAVTAKGSPLEVSLLNIEESSPGFFQAHLREMLPDIEFKGKGRNSLNEEMRTDFVRFDIDPCGRIAEPTWWTWNGYQLFFD